MSLGVGGNACESGESDTCEDTLFLVPVDLWGKSKDSYTDRK